MRAGVAQGDEKNPPRTPAAKAPKNPRLELLLIAYVDGMMLKTSRVWNAINTISTPRIAYHQLPALCISLPISAAAVPSTVSVTAIPSENVADSQKALRVSRCAVPPTYPITTGTLVSAHGVNEVSKPAKSASIGASHVFAAIDDDNDSSH